MFVRLLWCSVAPGLCSQYHATISLYIRAYSEVLSKLFHWKYQYFTNKMWFSVLIVITVWFSFILIKFFTICNPSQMEKKSLHEWLAEAIQESSFVKSILYEEYDRLLLHIFAVLFFLIRYKFKCQTAKSC